MTSEPTWWLVLDSARQLTRAGRSPFTLDSLIKHVQRRDPSRGRDSVSPIVQGMIVDAPGGPKSASGEVLWRVDRGLYVLIECPETAPTDEAPADDEFWVRHLFGGNDRVEGLVIARDADQRIRYALAVVPDVEPPKRTKSSSGYGSPDPPLSCSAGTRPISRPIVATRISLTRNERPSIRPG